MVNVRRQYSIIEGILQGVLVNDPAKVGEDCVGAFWIVGAFGRGTEAKSPGSGEPSPNW